LCFDRGGRHFPDALARHGYLENTAHMYELLHEQGNYFWLLLVSILSVSIVSLLAVFFIRFVRLVYPLRGSAGIVTTMLSGILLPTGMVIAFVASDIWKMDENGRAALEEEGAALSDIVRISKYLPAAEGEKMLANLRLYTEAVLDEEWHVMNEGLDSPIADQALNDLMLDAHRIENRSTDFRHAAIGQELRHYVKNIEVARDKRLAIAQSSTRGPKWVAVFILLFVSACVIAELHYGAKRSRNVALGLFSLGFGVTIFLITAYDRPYKGLSTIEPVQLHTALSRSYK